MSIKQTMIICFGMALILMTVGTATASIITVNNSTGQVADFTSIQAAIDDVNTINGDTISVYPGTYTENVDVYKELTIISKSGNPDDTHVKAADSNDHVFNVTSDNVTISGFNATGANIFPNAGIYLNRVYSNTICDNKLSSNNFGIYLESSNNNMLIGNTVSENKRNGIYLVSISNDNKLIDNIVSDNSHGIYLWSSSNNKLNNNTATNNYNGFYIRSSSNNEFNNNTAINNKVYGIFLWYNSNNNKLDNNNASSNDNYGIYLYNSNNDNELNNNTVNLNNIAGIRLRFFSNNNKLNNNIICNNSQCGISISEYSNNTTIYNNIFNNQDNILDDGTNKGNVWNITKTPGTNIVGGPFLGGNFWANTTGTGFSQINVDTDGDGFCDSQFDFAGNTDYLPLHLYEDSELSPIEKTEALKEYVDDLDEEVADASTKHVLNVKLDNVIDKLNKEDDGKAIKKLEDFIKFVGIMERQDKLGDGEAAYLINEANHIIEFIQNSAE